jgi:hypothetical protein
MFVFFVNFKANQEALNYFMFGKGKPQNFAKNYGGTDAIETFGYESHYDSNRAEGDAGDVFEDTGDSSTTTTTTSTSQ